MTTELKHFCENEPQIFSRGTATKLQAVLRQSMTDTQQHRTPSLPDMLPQLVTIGDSSVQEKNA